MKNLTATFCLTIAVFLGNAGVSWSADFQTGVDAYARRDYATALREWTPLADQGYAGAQRSLGEMYRQGNGVRQNDKTAAWLFRLAAEQGDVGAQVKLGEMYADGKGVPRDYVYAYLWTSIAASSLDRAAIKIRDKIAGRLSAAQIEKAQELIRECTRKVYRGC
ncbi:MAG: tetratricopeptide repeat protein [Proteobacteria bacterium]|nr:tetratricopeptide repeat protein [Pseudomonadota bacterium]